MGKGWTLVGQCRDAEGSALQEYSGLGTPGIRKGGHSRESGPRPWAGCALLKKKHCMSRSVSAPIASPHWAVTALPKETRLTKTANSGRKPPPCFDNDLQEHETLQEIPSCAMSAKIRLCAGIQVCGLLGPI